jgi:hypothetical protein
VHNWSFLVNGRADRFRRTSTEKKPLLDFPICNGRPLEQEGMPLSSTPLYWPLSNRHWGRKRPRAGQESTANAVGVMPSLVLAVMLNFACVGSKGAEESVVDGSTMRSAVRVDGSASWVTLPHGAKTRERSAPLRKIATEAVDGTHALPALCTAICERSRKLRCKNTAECEHHCQAMGLVTGCNEQMVALYRCLGEQTLDHWECAEDGVAAIRDGFCELEQEKAVACVETKAK